MKIKRIIVVLITVLLCFSTTLCAFADSLNQKKNEINSKIQKAEKNVKEVKSQKSNLLKQIQALESSMVGIDAEVAKLDNQLSDINKKMIATQAELNELEEKRERHYELLKVRIRDMYENSTGSYLDMFLKSDSFIDLIDRMYNVKLIMDKDQEVLNSIKELENKVIEKKKEIEDNKLEVELLKTKQETKKHAMQSNIETQNKLITQLNATEKSYMNELEALEKESKEVEALIYGKTSGSTAIYSGGKFIWPVPGYNTVSSGFGYRDGFWLQDGTWSKPQFHSGIDIPAPKGSKIVATAAGTVITAGWVNGYGYTVIINHGSGLTSLYGHNSALVVSVGQTVSQGQQIAKCGTTGYSTGNHCHFEVRLNSKAVSPYNYLGK